MAVLQTDNALITEAEYLAGELRSETRHEYVDGQVFAMAGSSLRHNDIALNLAFALRAAARDQSCRVNVSDVRVHIEKSKAYYYPDVVVGCEPESEDGHSVDKPCLIAEVTSESTKWRDFTEKALAYQKLASLRAYLVIAQEQMQVTLYYRDDGGVWQVSRFDSPEQELTLHCPEVVVTVQTIYEGVVFNH